MPTLYKLLEVDQSGLFVSLVQFKSLFYGLLGSDGNPITPEQYIFMGLIFNSIDDQLDFYKKFGPFKIPITLDISKLPKEQKFDYMDRTQEFFELIRKEYNTGFVLGKEGMIPALLWGKWGYVGNDGKVVIPFEYDLVTHFINGRAEVLKGNDRYFIDKSGKKLNP
ncbi:MAG: WG repeat-containing protein [Bacteroidota bacterium]